jgi:hypothetical protein
LTTSLEFVNERAIWWRERRSLVKPITYLCSKLFIYGLPCVIFPVCSLLGIRFIETCLDIELIYGATLPHILALSFTYLCSTCIGLAISSFVAHRKVASLNLAINLAVVFSIAQVIFAVFAPLHITHSEQDHEEAESVWLRPLSSVMPARWSQTWLLSNEDLCKQTTEEGQSNVKYKNVMLMRNCLRIYQNTGIFKADQTHDRVDQSHFILSSFSLIVLSLSALLYTLISLRRSP